MATFSGNAAGYRVDFLDNGKIRVVDIDAGDGDTGKQIVFGDQALIFNDRTYQLVADSAKPVGEIGFSRLNPAITTLADGGYVITWTSFFQDGSDYGIYTQRYDAMGIAVGGETRTNSTTKFSQMHPDVTALADGGYLVAWASVLQDGGSWGIYAQRYDAMGIAVGGETLINSTTSNSQDRPDAAALADGGYVITWTSSRQDGGGDGVYAQRYDAAGLAVGGETRINTDTAKNQFDPHVTALMDGGYVITWMSEAPGEGDSIRAQRYDAAGNILGGEARISSITANDQRYPAIAALADGGYLITWAAYSQDAIDNGIYARRYDAAGNEVGGETRINSGTVNNQSDPVVAALADGGYVITWISDNRGSYGDGIYVQRYDVAGNKMGGEARIDADMLEPKFETAITALADGGYVVTWTAIHDGSYVVYTRIFDAHGHSIETSEATLYGTMDADVFNGGIGAERFWGLDGDDTLRGGNGDDWLGGGFGNDTLAGNDGNDRLRGENGRDILSGGGGDDEIHGSAGNDMLNGGQGADLLYGEDDDDTLYGGGGNDFVQGGDGDDVLNGGAGDDTLNGIRGADTLNGGNGDDRLIGGRGTDILNGETGNDRLFGGDKVDVLDGGRGNDSLNGGLGNDALTGGVGPDNFIFNSQFSIGVPNIDIVTDFSAIDGDVIQLEDGIFKKLTASDALSAANFAANLDGAAQDADDYIVYETDTGKLFYDADGNGAGAEVQFALIANLAVLTAADFEVI